VTRDNRMALSNSDICQGKWPNADATYLKPRKNIASRHPLPCMPLSLNVGIENLHGMLCRHTKGNSSLIFG
jgi:hypothetical protein